MKKLLFATLILALFNSVSASADVVSLDKATAAARQYFNDGAVTRAGAIEPVLAWTYNEVTKGPYAPAFYVFNNPQGGWMIISGEDSGRAILAWSDEGSFDPNNMPDNTEAWLEEYANQINWAREHNLKPSEASAKEWSDLLEGHIRRTVQVKVLDNIATWGQGTPYNQNCPRINGSYVSYDSGNPTYTGCVATATAIVMRYYKHPAHGTGTVGGYSKYIKTTDINPSPVAPSVTLGEYYDWDDMKLQSTYTDRQKAAIAKLMFHIGLAVKMEYGTSSSSSTQLDIHRALVNNFGYDPSMRLYSRGELNESSWLKLFKSELDDDRPLLVAGRNGGGTGGHEFVATGYDSGDRIQINWGWSPINDYNGYFALNFFKTTAGDASGGDYRYSQTVLAGIKPNESGQEAYSLGFYGDGFYLKPDSELDLASPNKNFLVYVRVYNRGGIKVSPCSTGVYVCDYRGESIGLSSEEVKSLDNLPSNNSQTYNNLSCNLRNRNKPLLGDKLMVFYKNSSGIFVPIVGQGNGYNNNIPIFDTPFIAVKDGGIYNVGDYFDFEIVNTRKTRSQMTVTWTFDGVVITNVANVLIDVNGQVCKKLTDAGTHTIKAVVTIDNVTQTLVQEITVVEP